jgi:hypothetical protein
MALHQQEISLPNDLSHCGVFLPETVCWHCRRGNVHLDNHKCGSSYKKPNWPPINFINSQLIARIRYDQVNNAFTDILFWKHQMNQPLLHMSHLGPLNNFYGYPDSQKTFTEQTVSTISAQKEELRWILEIPPPLTAEISKRTSPNRESYLPTPSAPQYR